MKNRTDTPGDEEMSVNRAVEILREHNQWRRGLIDEQEAGPLEIGIAIDTILEYLDRPIWEFE